MRLFFLHNNLITIENEIAVQVSINILVLRGKICYTKQDYIKTINKMGRKYNEFK